jgi:GxxExxY protein
MLRAYITIENMKWISCKRRRELAEEELTFFVEKCIMVELKAVIQMEDVYLAQAINYLEAYNVEIGLLINFGAKSLQFKRVHNNSLKP